MQIIKNQQVIDDHWQMIEDGALTGGDFIIPFARWKKERNELVDRKGKLGVSLNGDDDFEEFIEELKRLDLIALEFPKYTDGRCFSFARLLRERYQYQGELRAVGNVLRDQISFLSRCGIDSIQLDSSEDLQEALKSYNEISVKYQSAADAAEPLYRYR